MFSSLPESFPENGDQLAGSHFLRDTGTRLHGFEGNLEQAIQVVPLG